MMLLVGMMAKGRGGLMGVRFTQSALSVAKKSCKIVKVTGSNEEDK